MRAIKIDVEKRQVYEIDLKEGLQAMYQAIGNGCRLVEVPIYYPNDDAMFSDEEALLKEQVGGFMLDGWAYPISNNALIVGTDENGDNTHAKTGIKDLGDITWFGADVMEAYRERALENGPTIFFW